MASYKFPWRNEAGETKVIINKTYVFKDPVGNIIPVTVTHTTSDSPAFYQEQGYTTLTEESRMYINYEWEKFIKDIFIDSFIDTFLPNREDNVNFDSWMRAFDGLGCSEEDIYKTSRSRFVLAGFGN